MTTYEIPTFAGQRIPAAGNLLKFLLLASLLAGAYVLMDGIAAGFGASWPVVAQAAALGALAVGNGVLMIGLGVLAHDAGHRVLFRNVVVNDLVGGIAAAIMLTPYYANRQFHLTHHAYAHQRGADPEDEMHHRPFWQAIVVGSTIGLYLQYRTMWRSLTGGAAGRRQPGRVAKDAMFLGAGAAFHVALPLVLGLDLRFTVVPTLLAFPFVFSFRALSDHYGLAGVARRSHRREDVTDGMDWYQAEDGRKSVTGWVVLTNPVLEWLWSSVNYHEVHHKYPYLSHAHLRDVFRQTRGDVPYRVVNGYFASLRNLRRRPYYERVADGVLPATSAPA